MLVRELFPCPRFEGTKDEVCDFLINWQNLTVLAECKASLLTAKIKYSSDSGLLFKGIDDQLVGQNSSGKRKGVSQLAHSINRLIGGERAILAGNNVTPDAAQPIIPLLIIYEPTMGYHSVRNRLQRKFDALLTPEAIQSGRILPVVILTIDELERLQALSNAAPARDILHEYAKHLQLEKSCLLGSFSTYLWERFPDARVANDSSVRVGFHAFMKQVESSFRANAENEEFS